ncbi:MULTISPECIES: RNA polymerase sigma factor [Sphingobium]|uniref:RNA polymerase sigma factor n=1 Tax=Sphingobium TaxID=165695 RepID=UPI00159C5A74|nr:MULTISPECIES: RNA polymerase sigma factor [unclassified Sphingobium]
MKRDRATELPDPARAKADAGLIAPRRFEKEDRAPTVDLLDFLSQDYVQFLRRLTRKFGSIDFATDVLQDLYVRICTGSLSSSIDKPRAYLYRMAVNLGHNLVRREKRNTPLDASMIENLVDTAPDSERVLIGISELNFVLHELSMLPERRRAIFLARWRDEKELATIASEFGLHRRTVQKELARTEAHLRFVLRRADSFG